MTWTDPTFEIQHVENYGILTALSGDESTVRMHGKDYPCKVLVSTDEIGVGSQVKLITNVGGVNTWIPREYPFRPAYALHLSDVRKKCPAAATELYFMRNNRKKYDYRIGRVTALVGSMVAITRPNNSVRVMPVWKPDGVVGSFSVGDLALVYAYGDGREVAILGNATYVDFWVRVWISFVWFSGQTSHPEALCQTYGVPYSSYAKMNKNGFLVFPLAATFWDNPKFNGVQYHQAIRFGPLEDSFIESLGTEGETVDKNGYKRITSISAPLQKQLFPMDKFEYAETIPAGEEWLDPDHGWVVDLGPGPVLVWSEAEQKLVWDWSGVTNKTVCEDGYYGPFGAPPYDNDGDRIHVGNGLFKIEVSV